MLLFRDSKGGDGHPEYRPATASGRQTNKKFHTRQSARMAAHSEGEGQGTEHSQRSGWSTSSASLPSTVCDPVQHGLGRRFFIATEEQVCCVRGQRSVIGSRNGHGSGSGATTAWAAGCTRRTRRWCSAARTGRSHLRSTALPRRILSWKLLAEAGLRPALVLLVTMPYRGRRACAAIRRLWPEAEGGLRVRTGGLPDYLAGIGNARLVIDCHARRFAVAPHVPENVHTAYQALVNAGSTSG